MKDEKKFGLFIGISVLLIIISLLFNVFGERFSKDIGSYLERRFYYERVISKKGLSLHRALYWSHER
ncbi:MAG: hypothetical protein ACK4TF_01985 [Thermodesulfovibrionales bacterium]